MILQIITAIGQPPITLEVTQWVAYQNNGTPLAVGAEYGPSNTQAISMVGQKDFERMLSVLGVHTTVVVDHLQTTKPQPGAKLFAAPQ